MTGLSSKVGGALEDSGFNIFFRLSALSSAWLAICFNFCVVSAGKFSCDF